MSKCSKLQFSLRLIWAVVAIAGQCHVAFAQNGLSTPLAPDVGSNTSAATADTQMPNDYRLNLLIRTSIIALNHANRTGNYTVLRDLGAPNFQLANTAAKLSEAFTALRASGFDLSPILFFEPKLVKKPEIQNNGLLRLSGFFPTQPQQVNFDLAFQKNQDEWRLFGIAITTTPASTAVGDGPQNGDAHGDKVGAAKPAESNPVKAVQKR